MAPRRGHDEMVFHWLFPGFWLVLDAAPSGGVTWVLAGVAREAMCPRRRWVSTAVRSGAPVPDQELPQRFQPPFQ